MKLKYQFETVAIDDGIIAVPVGQKAEGIKGVLRLNPSGLEIFELLKKDITEKDIINTLLMKYNDDYETIASYVKTVLQVLKNNELIME